MDMKIIKEEIDRIFEALSEQLDMIQNHSGKIPQIEIDLVMGNIRDLYESLHQLNLENNRSLQSNPIPITEESTPIPSASHAIPFIEKIPEPILEPTPEPTLLQQQEPEIILVEEIHLITPAPMAEEPKEVFMEPTPIPQPQPEPPITRSTSTGDLFATIPSSTIADKFKDDKKSLNDRIQQEKTDHSLSARLQHNQIKEIKNAIGINEKFQFINHLFNGSMQEYTIAISQLNQFRNHEEASQFVDILKFKYNWDMNSDAYHKLMDIVRRRYTE